jgi:MioC protein
MIGTDECVVKGIQIDCAKLARATVRMTDGLDSLTSDENALYLICSSTVGSGDLRD